MNRRNATNPFDDFDPRQCERCGKERDEVKQMDRHHTSYKKDEWIALCQRCHTIVHENPDFFNELMPEMSRREAKEKGYRVT